VSPRTIESFDPHKLLIGGEIVERDGSIHIEIKGQTTPMKVRGR